MSTVAEIIERTGVDITLNGSLLTGYDLAVLHVGGLGYGSGFLMVKCDNRSDVDLLGRPLYEWRIMDNAGCPVADGEGLCDLDGNTHPMDGLAALMENLIYFDETGQDRYNDGFSALSEDYLFELHHYIAPLLPQCLADLYEAIDSLDNLEPDED